MFQNKIAYLREVKNRYPLLYRAAASKKSQGLSGLGLTVEEMIAEQNAFAEPQTGWTTSIQSALDSVIKSVQQLAPTYAGLKQAELLMKINASRAQQGLPLLSQQDLAPQVNFGLSTPMQVFMFAALGVGAVYLISRKR